jgi:hypothetical protein
MYAIFSMHELFSKLFTLGTFRRRRAASRAELCGDVCAALAALDHILILSLFSHLVLLQDSRQT